MENKNNYVQYEDIKTYNSRDINFQFDNMVNSLLKAAAKGDFVSCEFKGNNYYSDTIRFDDPYIDYYDMLKNERDYYLKNKNEVIVNILSSSISKECIKDTKFKEYVHVIINNSRDPKRLQIYDYITKCSEDMILNNENRFNINRFNAFNNVRKSLAKQFIDYYFIDEYKQSIINYLNIEDANSIENLKAVLIKKDK